MGLRSASCDADRAADGSDRSMVDRIDDKRATNQPVAEMALVLEATPRTASQWPPRPTSVQALVCRVPALAGRNSESLKPCVGPAKSIAYRAISRWASLAGPSRRAARCRDLALVQRVPPAPPTQPSHSERRRDRGQVLMNHARTRSGAESCRT